MNVKLVRPLPSEKLVKVAEPESMAEKIALLTSQVKALQQAFLVTKRALIASKNNSRNAYDNKKDAINIPVGTTLIGTTKGIPYLLTVGKNGKFNVGKSSFKSLSSAAEAVSGHSRSGWVFWKTLDGITAKEAFRKRDGKTQEQKA